MTKASTSILFLVAGLIAVPGCAGGVDDGEAPRSAAIVGAGADDDPAAAAAPAAVRDWRPWVAAELDRLRVERAAYVDEVMNLPVRATRAGFPRITGPIVRDRDAAPILIHRLLTAGESAEVRAAIVDALPRTEGDFSAAVAELITTETDERVRELLSSALARAQAPFALEGLAVGLTDASPRVRAEAVRSLGRRTDGASLATGLVTALGDGDVVVQQEAARALGNLEVRSAADALVGALASPDADLRRHSLRALSRVDPERARTLPQLQTLRSDPDPKIARLADELARP